MDTKDSRINREVGRQLKREQAVSPLSVKALSHKTGISESVINRMWSKNPRDINVTQLTWLAALLDTTPQELIEQALVKAGGLAAVMDELSAAAGTTDDLATLRHQKEADEMSPAEIGSLAIAATEDAERQSDEPAAP